MNDRTVFFLGYMTIAIIIIRTSLGKASTIVALKNILTDRFVPPFRSEYGLNLAVR